MKNKKIIACILVFTFLIITGTVYAQNAQAAAASALAIGGSLVIDAGVVSQLFAIAMNPAGLTPNLIAKAEAEGVTYIDVAETLVKNFCISRGYNFDWLLNTVKSGVSYDSEGKLYWDSVVSSVVGSFLDWSYSDTGGNLVQYDTASEGSQMQVETDLDISPYSSPLIFNNGAYGYFNRTTGVTEYYFTGKVFAYWSTRAYCILASDSRDGLAINYRIPNGSMYTVGLNIKSYTYQGKIVYYAQFTDNNTGWEWGPGVNVNSAYNGPANANSTKNIAWAMVYGDTVGLSGVNTGAYDFPEGSDADTNIFDGEEVVAVPDFGTGTADIGSWLGGLSDTIYTGNGSITVEDEQGLQKTVELDRTGLKTATLEQTTTADIPITVPVGDATSSDIVGEYTLDLRDYFPFCVPFDIYDMLKLFSGAPTAPDVEWRFYVPGIVDVPIDIDLSIFDPVATVLRTCELIAFAVMLAANTKKLLFGS